MRMHLVWLPRTALDQMRADADAWYAKETGGTFMGYWAARDTAVVTAIIPAGPHASHERNSFLPDQAWQQAEIARHYENSGRLDTYLGDWHTHPDEDSGRLSWKDKACLKTIIKTPAARNPKPIMVLMCGTPDDWALYSWVGHLQTRFVLFETLREEEARLQVYG